jgi:ribosomal protein S18 acetylase RimI-like enzyme
LRLDSEITVRPASADDAKVIRSLVIELAVAMDELDKVSSSIKDFRDALSGTDPAIHGLLVEQDGKPVGMAIFYLTFSTWRGSRGVYLQDIYLHPNVRGTGAGKQLLAKVVAWAIDRDADHLRLSVDSDNTNAQLFYESIGMSFCKKEKIYQISDQSLQQLGAVV